MWVASPTLASVQKFSRFHRDSGTLSKDRSLRFRFASSTMSAASSLNLQPSRFSAPASRADGGTLELRIACCSTKNPSYGAPSAVLSLRRSSAGDGSALAIARCSSSEPASMGTSTPAIPRVLESGSEPTIDGGGGGEEGPRGGGGGGGDHGGGGGGGDGEEEEFGPILKYEDVVRETEARGAKLPADMLEAAKSTGLRELILQRYLDLQGSYWPLGFLMNHCSMLRNRMLADPSFLFKVGTEIVIDSCCATFAEVQKRGKDFWSEFELYMADLLVGVVVDIALVGLLAPYVRIGQKSTSRSMFGRIQHACGSLPSSVFEAERPGCRFSIRQRIATYFYKGVLYGSVGFGCGLIGQGIANSIMTVKRNIKKSEEDIPVPPLIQSAALWGVFLAVSSNTRYQIINGLERLVEASPLVKNVPPVAMAFTVGVRFANNIYGGMQFVDWAKWSGVQ